ncbi:MAG: IPTL-CTERM sorting domain-containing protein [bacterium]
MNACKAIVMVILSGVLSVAPVFGQISQEGTQPATRAFGTIISQAAFSPSVEITGFNSLSSSACENTGLNATFVQLNTFTNGLGLGHSDGFVVNVDGEGPVTDPFCENGPFPDGASIYSIGLDRSYSVPPGTLVTASIDTYRGNDCLGDAAYRSTIVFRCDTGEVLSIESGAVEPSPIPTMGALGIGLLSFLLLAAGAYRRRSP